MAALSSYLFFGICGVYCIAAMAGDPAFAAGVDGMVSSENPVEAGAFRIDSLPLLRTGVQTHQFCSYDRAGDNYDWEYFPLYTDTNGECVIFDAMGPGCLYRHHMNVWHGLPVYQGVHIKYYFDDETTPRIDMDISTFFSTNNPLGIFQPPLAYNGAKRFRMFYHPMFFKKAFPEPVESSRSLL